MKERIIEMLKKLTKHSYIKLMSRGNTAIFAALYCARKINGVKDVLVPDQGGWVSYLKYPKMLRMGVKLCKTDKALIDLDELKERSKGCCAFLYANPGGYFVDESINTIYSICKKNKCLVIMDVTGCVGTELCDGNYADFIVCSFGNYKPVNLGYGGAVSASKKEYFEKPKEIFNTDKFDTAKLSLLSIKIKSTEKRYQLFEKINKKIKDDLKKFDIIHRNKKGINVLVKFKDEKEKNKIIQYCEKNNFKYKVCKKVNDSTKNLFSFIKVNEDAISIEVQRLK